MTKLYTLDDLSSQWERDMAWRIKEISDYKSAIKINTSSRSALLRGFVPICYAHWEGYVKQCATHYFDFISLRKKKFEDLVPQFYVNYFLPKIDSFYKSKGDIKQKSDFIKSILLKQNMQFNRLDPKLIDTKSNLNSDVLNDLCTVCNVSVSVFEPDFIFIDKQLIQKRNAIAHGEHVHINYADMDSYSNKVITLMRSFRTLLENNIYQNNHLAK